MTQPAMMQALQLQGLNRLMQVTMPVPQPKVDELLVRTVATTLCTSDLNDIARNPFAIPLPRVLGHEGAGVVAAVGSKVSGFGVGDTIASHPVIPCHTCENCARGLGHLCARMGHLGLDRDGTFAGFYCIRADRARRVPQNLSLPTAALLEPVAVCLEAVERGRIQRGESVLIVGDGPFGVMIARLVAKKNPARVFFVGRHDFRLNQVSNAIRIKQSAGEDLATTIISQNGGQGVDVAIMAAGTQAAFDLCAASLRARGRVVVFSALDQPAQVNLFALHVKELEILGACNDENLIDAALAQLGDPALGLHSLVTHQIPFNDWQRAFDLARNGKDSALKVALTFDSPA